LVPTSKEQISLKTNNNIHNSKSSRIEAAALTSAAQSTGNYKTSNMKFINYLEKITSVDIYAMTSFMIFFAFFLGMSLWAWKADKELINKINNIPLDESNHSL
jgi:hypothetical protein